LSPEAFFFPSPGFRQNIVFPFSSFASFKTRLNRGAQFLPFPSRTCLKSKSCLFSFLSPSIVNTVNSFMVVGVFPSRTPHISDGAGLDPYYAPYSMTKLSLATPPPIASRTSPVTLTRILLKRLSINLYMVGHVKSANLPPLLFPQTPPAFLDDTVSTPKTYISYPPSPLFPTPGIWETPKIFSNDASSPPVPSPGSIKSARLFRTTHTDANSIFLPVQVQVFFFTSGNAFLSRYLPLFPSRTPR